MPMKPFHSVCGIQLPQILAVFFVLSRSLLVVSHFVGGRSLVILDPHVP